MHELSKCCIVMAQSLQHCNEINSLDCSILKQFFFLKVCLHKYLWNISTLHESQAEKNFVLKTRKTFYLPDKLNKFHFFHHLELLFFILPSISHRNNNKKKLRSKEKLFPKCERGKADGQSEKLRKSRWWKEMEKLGGGVCYVGRCGRGVVNNMFSKNFPSNFLSYKS